MSANIVRILFFIILVTAYFSQKEKTYNSDVITFGSSLPKTGIMQEFGDSVYKGANAYFQYVNENNLLNKMKINFTTYDDQYEPDITLENTNKLLQDEDLFLLFSFVGTPTIKRILFDLKDSDVPFIAPITGANFLRDNNYDNIVNFRSSYHQEIENIVDYLFNEKNITKFSVFYQNDDYGESGYVSTINVLKKYNLEYYSSGSYKRNTLSLQQAFSDIVQNKPEAIIMIGAYKANFLFIEKIKQMKKLDDVIFANISFGNADAMIKEPDFNSKNVIFSQVVPLHLKHENLIKQYRKIFKKYYPNDPYGFISLEAFLSAKMTVDALQNINSDITRGKFLEEIKKISKDNTYFNKKVYLYKLHEDKFLNIGNKNN